MFPQLDQMEREFLGETHKTSLSSTTDFQSTSVHGRAGLDSSDEECTVKPSLFRIAFDRRGNSESSNQSNEVEPKEEPDVSDFTVKTKTGPIGYTDDENSIGTQPPMDDNDDDTGPGINSNEDNEEKEDGSMPPEETHGRGTDHPPQGSEPLTVLDDSDATRLENDSRDDSEVHRHIDVVFHATADLNTSLKELLKKVVSALGRKMTAEEKNESRSYIRRLVNERMDIRRSAESSNKENVESQFFSDVNIGEGKEAPSSQKPSSRESITIEEVVKLGCSYTVDEFMFCQEIKAATPTKQTAVTKSDDVAAAISDYNEADDQTVDHSCVSATVSHPEPTKALPKATTRKRGRPSANQSGTNSNDMAEDTKHPALNDMSGPKLVATSCMIHREQPQIPPPQAPSACTTKEESHVKVVSASIPKPPPQRRARKGTCALCATCPCNTQVDKGDDTCAPVFARSDSAVEKALIRRVQKMEKTCELHESRMEMVKRKLLQHRREMWKKKESKHSTSHQKAKRQVFLPDADDEVAQNSSHCGPLLSKETVQRAVTRLFPEAPCVQGTLSQWLGFPRKESSSEKKPSEEGVLLETIMEEEDDMSESGGNAMPMNEEEEEYIEYSTGTEDFDQVYRQQWDQRNLLITVSSRFSLWKGVSNSRPTLQNDVLGLRFGATQNELPDSDKDVNYSCPWDDLFRTDTFEGSGIDQLVGLFGKDDSVEGEGDKESPSPRVDEVHLSDLSQSGHIEAVQIIESLEREARKVEMLRASCPNWKENIAFSMKQKDEDAVTSALEHVRKKRRQMAEFKRRIMDAWEQQDVALDVFENSLSTRLTSLNPTMG